MNIRLIACLAPLAVLAACSSNSDEENGASAGNDDNADLAAQDGSANGLDTSASAIEAARERAAQMVGGPEELVNPGQPRRLAGSDTVTATMRQAATTMQGDGDCFSNVEYTTSWAAKLPAEFPVYPRGNTVEAAGTDAGNCAMRVVSFRTPVPLEDVMAFYYTRAEGAGYDAEYVQVENEHVLSGTNGNAAFTIYGRRAGENLTEVDLTTSKP